ncbi:MAG: PKD domain-containing protein [Anaerolineaceae bacterium]|nr:PKD domain-containing protein [Anaerolineaceae bacterium]
MRKHNPKHYLLIISLFLFIVAFTGTATLAQEGTPTPTPEATQTATPTPEPAITVTPATTPEAATETPTPVVTETTPETETPTPVVTETTPETETPVPPTEETITPDPTEATEAPTEAAPLPEATEIVTEEPTATPTEAAGIGIMALQTFCQMDISDLGDNNPFTYEFSAINANNIASFSWDLGDTTTSAAQTVSHTYASTGSYTITLTCVPNFGSNIVLTGSISISSVPVADFSLTPGTVITGLPPFNISTVNQSTGGALSYAWEVTDDVGTVLLTSTDENISYSFPTYGTYWFRLNVTDGAGVTSGAVQSVVFNAPPPSANFTLTPTDGTSPLLVTVEGVDLGMGPITNWSFDFGDGSPVVTGQGPHTHTFTLVNPAVPQSFFITMSYSGPGGSGTFIREVGLYPPSEPVNAIFTWQSMGNVPGGVEICFTNESTGPVTLSRWDFDGDGTYDEVNNDAVVCHTYPLEGSFLVRLWVENADASATSTSSELVTVIGAPVAAFSVIPGTTITWGSTIDLDSSASTGVITSWSWDFNGDGIEDSSVDNPTGITLANLGNNPIRLTVTGPGGTSYTEVIVLVARLEITCDFTGTLNVLPTAGAQTYQSVIGNDGGRAITYNWTVTGSSASLPLTFGTQDISVNWAAIGTGSFVVTLEASTADGSNCSTSKTVTRTWPALDCQMNDNLTTPLFPDGNTYTFNADVQNLNGRTVTSYSWSVDGVDQGVGAASFNRVWPPSTVTPLTEVIRYDVVVDNGDGTSSNCYEEKSVTVDSYPNPTCLITTNLPTPLYPDGNTYTFTANTSNLYGRTVVGYEWYIGGVAQGVNSATFTRSWSDSVNDPGSEVISYSIIVDNGNGTQSGCNDDENVTINTWPGLTCGSITGQANPIPQTPNNMTRNYNYTANLNGVAGRTVTYSWAVTTSPTIPSLTTNPVNVSWPVGDASLSPGTAQNLSVVATVHNPDSTTDTCDMNRNVNVQVPRLVCNLPLGDVTPVVNETVPYTRDVTNVYGRNFDSMLWELELSDGAGGWTPVTTGTADAFSYTFLTPNLTYRLRYTASVDYLDDNCTSNWQTLNVTGAGENFFCDAFPGGANPVDSATNYSFTADMDNGNNIDLNYTWVLVGPGAASRTLGSNTSTANGLISSPGFAGALFSPVGNYTLRVDVEAVNNTNPALPGYSDYTCSMNYPLVVGTLNVNYTYTDNGGGALNNNAVEVGQQICITNTSNTSLGDISQLTYDWAISGNAGDNSLGITGHSGQQLPGCISFSQPGTYTIDLTGTNDYQGDASFQRSGNYGVTFTVYGHQSIAITRSNQTFAPATVTFNAYGTNITSNYDWQFINIGTGATVGTRTGATVNQFFGASGNYRAIVTGSGPLGATSAMLEFTLIDASQLRAAFTPSIYGGVAPMTVCFTDNSVGTNIQTWSWDFGNGQTLDYTNATIPGTICTTYTTPATTYTVRLTISNGLLIETATNTVRAYSLLESSATFSITPDGSARYCFLAQLTGDLVVTGWEFGDGATDGAANQTCHTYAAAGTYVVRMHIENGSGETGTVVRTVTVDPTGGATPNLAASGSCSAARSATFHVTNSGGAMTTADQVTIRDKDGNIVLIDALLLGAGESKDFVVSDQSGGVSFSTVDYNLTATTTCEYPPDIHVEATCNGRLPQFTISNNDGPMIAPQTYEIRNSSGTVVDSGSFQMARGDAPITVSVPAGNDFTDEYTFVSNGAAGNFSVAKRCGDAGSLSVTSSCSEPAGFTVTNTGAAMQAAHTYQLTSGSGADLTPANNLFQLGAGASLFIPAPAGADLNAGLTFSTNSLFVTASATMLCGTGGAVPTPAPEVAGLTSAPASGGINAAWLRFNGLSTDILNLPAWGGVPTCGYNCPPFRLYHTNETGDWEIFRLDGADAASRQSYRENLTFGEGEDVRDMSPSLSPNSAWIVFTSNRDGNWEIYVASTAGDRDSVQRVTYNTVAIDTDPVWGPNNYVVFETTRHGQWDLYMVDMSTGQEYRLTDDLADDINPFWSPDGSKLIFQSNRVENPDDEKKWQIYELDLLTMSITKLSDGQSVDVDPQYANNGQRIVYRTYRDGSANSQIAIMNADGSGSYTITALGEDATNPVWSPADHYIAYQSNHDGDLDVYVYEVGTGEVRQLTNNVIDDYAPTWLCGEDRLVFTSDIMGSPDIFEADALPIVEPSILVEEDADQMTFEDWLDIYPQNFPVEENASREGRTILGKYGEQTVFLQPDTNLTPVDLSLDGLIREDWGEINTCPAPGES